MSNIRKTLIELKMGLHGPLSQHALETLQNASQEQRAATPKRLRFEAIANIVKSINKRFPVQKGLEHQKVPANKIQNEQQALLILCRDLQFSDDYRALAQAGLKESMICFSNNIESAKKWLTLNGQQAQNFLQQEHNAYINGAQRYLHQQYGSSLTLTPHPVRLFQRPAIECDIEQRSFHLSGFVSSKFGLKPEDDPVNVNNHPDTKFSDISRATETTVHESGHIQEKTIGHAYEISEILEIKSPEYKIPEPLREDAELIHLQQETGAYISPRVGNPYPKQFNEAVPFKIGSAAKNQSTRQLRKASSTPPALL